MTKTEAVALFKEAVLPAIKQREQGYGNGIDEVMRREAWNNFTDSLCKNNQISDWQYENWSQPAVCDGD